jgi:basic amino acid/polyamine antiporter, APA family
MALMYVAFVRIHVKESLPSRSSRGSIAVNNFKNQMGRIKEQIFYRKPMDQIQADATVDNTLHRTLNGFDLVLLGIGGIVGSGIFVLTGQAAALYAGPAIVISFLIAGFAAFLSALCYSEMASIIPVAGSAYTYAYAIQGELIAWIIGWDLILEYLVGAASVAVGWSGYFTSFLHEAFKVTLSPVYTQAPILFDTETQAFVATGNIIDLPAMMIVVLITIILVIGVQESSRFNTVVVLLKLTVILLFIFAAISKVNPSNWSPFVPPRENGKYGALGVFQGATVVFFAYIGFDAVSTTAQECKNPGRDLPIGIMGSFFVCMVLYLLVALLMTGITPYQYLSTDHPLSFALSYVGLEWMAAIVALGALAGMSSVILVSLMGQPRIFFSMASDGLLPKFFARIHPKFKTPYVTTIITGLSCAILAGVLPLDLLAELTSVGTLFAFFLVCSGVCILRLREPELERKFKVPGGPFLVPVTGALSCLLLIAVAPPRTLLRLFIWMFIGLLIYAFYGIRNSKLSKSLPSRIKSQSLLLKPEDELQMSPIPSEENLPRPETSAAGTYV